MVFTKILSILMHIQNMIKIHQLIHKILSINKILMLIQGHNSVENLRKIKCNFLNLDLIYINAYINFYRKDIYDYGGKSPNRICNQIQFYLIFCVYHYMYSFDGLKHNFSQLFLWLWHMFGLAWTSDMHFEKPLILTANSMVYFYTHGSWIYTFRQLDRYLFNKNNNHKYIHLYSWCFKDNVKSSFS